MTFTVMLLSLGYKLSDERQFLIQGQYFPKHPDKPPENRHKQQVDPGPEGSVIQGWDPLQGKNDHVLQAHNTGNHTMTHGQKRELFTISLAMLLMRMHTQGYRPRLDWVKRDPEFGSAGWDASLHPWSLAADINLFTDDGNFLMATDDHRPFGEFWESLSELHVWGGRFDDGNHYGITHNGIK